MKLKPPVLKCPFCGAIITDVYVAGKPLACHNCQRQLMISPWHLRLTSLGGTLATLLVCLLLNLRGIRLLVVLVILWFPLSLIWTFLLNAAIPPRLEAFRDNTTLRKANKSGTHSSSQNLFPR